jgi:phosphate-selective porin OprO/OprP
MLASLGSRRWLSAMLVASGMCMIATSAASAQQAPAPAEAIDIKALLERMDRLEKQNADLQKALDEQKRALQSTSSQPVNALEASPAVIDEKAVQKIVSDYLDKCPPKECKEAVAEPECNERRYEVGKNLEFKASWKDGLWFETLDKAFTFHLGGRIDFDTTWYTAPHSVQNSIGTFNNYLDPNTGLQDGWDIRRFRLRADGTMWEQFDYRVEVDFAGALDLRRRTLGISPAPPATGTIADVEPSPAVRMTDVYMEYRDMPYLGTLRVGHQREILTFANGSSDNFQPFMERPLIFTAFNNDFQFDNGIVLYRNYLCNRLYSWVGVFRPNDITSNDDRDGGFSVGNGKYAYDARVTALPVWMDNGREWLLLGAAYSFRELPFNQTRFRATPEVQSATGTFQVPNIINTGTILSGHGEQIFNLEAASAWGPLTLTAEWSAANLTDSFTSTASLTLPPGPVTPARLTALGLTPRGTYFAQGFYVEALYFLTGESRPLRLNQPAYERVPVEEKAFWVRGPHGNIFGTGAWEVGVRYDYIDLSNHGINGGFAHALTLGANWYLNPNMKLQFNYIWMNRNFEPTDFAGRQEGDFEGFGVRYHVDF